MSQVASPPRAPVSDAEIRDWAQEPVTKYFVKSLNELRESHLRNAMSYYVEGSPNETYGNIAEIAGAIKLIDSLLKSTVDGTLLFDETSLTETE